MSKDHDINAEVEDIQTVREMTMSYCYFGDAEELDLEALKSYLSAHKADVTTLVVPAMVGETEMSEWLKGEFGEGSVVLTESNSRADVDRKLVMAALVDKSFESEITLHKIYQILDLTHPALFFTVKDINFVVTELCEGVNVVPADWSEVKANAVVYNPDYNAIRKTEADYLVNKTIESAEYLYDKNWMWCINVNAESNVDLKYTEENHIFPIENYYDFATNEVDMEAFLGLHTKSDENLVATDAYFGANKSLVYAGLVDCIATQHSFYQAACTDGSRTNFLYASAEFWNMIEPIAMDKGVDVGSKYYPIMVSLKVEE